MGSCPWTIQQAMAAWSHAQFVCSNGILEGNWSLRYLRRPGAVFPSVGSGRTTAPPGPIPMGWWLSSTWQDGAQGWHQAWGARACSKETCSPLPPELILGGWAQQRRAVLLAVLAVMVWAVGYWWWTLAAPRHYYRCFCVLVIWLRALLSSKPGLSSPIIAC